MSNQKNDPVKFYHNEEDYYQFSNFYPASFNISKLPEGLNFLSSHLVRNDWKTSEHLFQAAKFIDPEIIREIYEASTPGEVYRLANGNSGKYIKEIRPDWRGINLKVMLWVVKEKFDQNPELEEILRKTGERKIVENTQAERRWNDEFWGNGWDGKGKNHLGEILMKVREEIVTKRGEYIPTTEPETPEDKKKRSLIEENIRAIQAKLNEYTSEQVSKIIGDVLPSNWESGYRNDFKNSIEDIKSFKEGIISAINDFATRKKFKTNTGDNTGQGNEGNSNNSNGSNNNNEGDNSNNESNQNEENQGTNEQPTQPEPSPSQPNQEPTQQQKDNAKDKLEQIQEDSNEEDIVKIIKEVSETIKNSGDENLKKQKEEAEKKLSKDKLRQIIREEIKIVLSEEGVKTEELTPSVKQKLDELNNNNNNNNDQATLTEVFNEIGQQSLNKLINEVEKALKLGKKVLESKIAELKKFINSKVDYKQNAYKLQKNKVEKLISQAQGKLVQNKDNEGFLRLNNPVMWVSGVVIISLVVGAGLLVIRVRRKRKGVK